MSTYDLWTQKAVCPGKPLTRKELDAYHLRRWNELLTYVKAHGPYYQSYPDHLNSLADVQALPTFCVQELKQYGHRMLCVSQSEIDRILTVERSGTTGRPKRLFFTKEDLEATVAFYAQGYLELIEPGDVVLVLYPHSREYSVGRLVGKALERMGARPVYGMPNAPFAEMCRLMETEQVNSISGQPATVLSLARYCEQFGHSFPIKSLMICGDYFSPFARQEMERIWPGKAFDHYGLAESGLGMALECSEHKGMHIWETNLYVEILDEEGKLVPDGEWGEVTLTTLARRGQPLIRYRTGDKSRILPGPCGCGSVLKRLDRILGRIADEKKPRSIHGLDEVIFPLSADIIDYAAHETGTGLHLDVVSSAPKEMLLSKLQAVCPDVEKVMIYPPEHAMPLCAGKRAFQNEPLDCTWSIR
ncbi:MAG: phenylacetate--CoA ligase family protein [Oscillospiraceae bacterium]|nr:phenylacetate--CoA ligase family protein [Oscillospiraceae bacterium]